MSQIFDMTTLITIAIAVFTLLRLRAVLGKRTGHQKPPPHMRRGDQDSGELRDSQAQTADEAADNVVSLPDRKKGKVSAGKEDFAAADAYAKPNTKLNRGLRAIIRHDPEFDPGQFLEGAGMAYEMIVVAFAQGDRRSLKNLLSREVYDGFAGSISERENRGEIMQSTFVGIEKAQISAADVIGNDAHVTVRFVSQIISATLDGDGNVIDGDPDQVAEVSDIWTFARDVRSRDPNWKLVATEAA